MFRNCFFRLLEMVMLRSHWIDSMFYGPNARAGTLLRPTKAAAQNSDAY